VKRLTRRPSATPPERGPLCDDCPNRHAGAHPRGAGHPLIRSIEPGETWSWCYVDDLALEIPGVHGERRIPPSPWADR
jgi:hypothetical protein